MTQETPIQARAPFAGDGADLTDSERALRQARIHLTEAINHSSAGRHVRAEQRLDEAGLVVYDHAPLPLWVEICEARVIHIRGERSDAREQVREVAQRLDAEIAEVGGE
jgi:hypothetical protein